MDRHVRRFAAGGWRSNCGGCTLPQVNEAVTLLLLAVARQFTR
jgi:hypothetical protein